MRHILSALALASLASAFPADIKRSELLKRAQKLKRADNATQQISMSETNCGPSPCLTFDAEAQYVSTTGQYVYASPAPDEIRGPCPGLNAAANHGYLPRNGIASIPETITGLGAAYGMSVDLAGFLAAYAVIFDGDILSQTWSIGGPMPGVASTLLGYPPQGISFSHNKYEGDTSLTRDDAYVNNGDAHSLLVPRFKEAYEYCTDDRCTMDKWRQLNAEIQYRAVRENPYYFAPLFSTTLVAPAAYNFIVNFMSNRTAEEPEGYLDGEIFKQFFAVTGDYPNFEWLPGQERIPENWYRRPTASSYNAVNVFQDLIVGWAAYPNTFRFGGNTDGVNTYTGIDIATLTGGTFDAEGIFEGNNFACLFFQTQQQAVPDELKGLVNDLAGALDIFEKYAAAPFELSCPQLAGYDNGPFDQYPGRTYSPTGPATNY